MAKGRLIYKEEVEIKGYPGLFLKECRLNIKRGESGVFYITHPKKIVSTDIIETDEVYSRTYKEVEDKYNEAVAIFEAVTHTYETVIMYQVEERGSYKDGSGEGFIFNWGVFRKVTTESGIEKLFFERTFAGSEAINLPYHSEILREWKTIKWSEQAENFFNELSRQVQSIYMKLEFFVNRVDIEEISNIKLLG